MTEDGTKLEDDTSSLYRILGALIWRSVVLASTSTCTIVVWGFQGNLIEDV